MTSKSLWTPSFAGKTLSPCRLIESFVHYNVRPSATDSVQRPWSEEALAPELKRFGDFRTAIWECVLALWRLKGFEEQGANSEEWQDHVGAWLVSRRLHRELGSRVDNPGSSLGTRLSSRAQRWGRSRCWTNTSMRSRPRTT